MKLKQLESRRLLITQQRHGRYVVIFIPVEMYDVLHLLGSFLFCLLFWFIYLPLYEIL